MPEELYGAPYLCMHRGDLHAGLASAVPSEVIHLSKKLTGLDQGGSGVTLSFSDGSHTQADAVIGADGVHSLVRGLLLGPDQPNRPPRTAPPTQPASPTLHAPRQTSTASN